MQLRSVELAVPRLEEAAQFLEKTWGLAPVAAAGSQRNFRATGGHPAVLSLEEGEPAIRAFVFSGDADEVGAVAARARQHACLLKAAAGSAEVQGPEGQVYRFLAGEKALPEVRDAAKPLRITHVVLNTPARETCERFAVDVLGFAVVDRTRHMTFVRCNRKHHGLAFAHAESASLNHSAFEVPSLEAVMRGIGRMHDAGFDAVWGPGRHGPGNNVFGYFIAPWGGVIEYTAEISEIGEDHRVGSPEDWQWPAGRIDHWGISKKDTSRTGPAERLYRFRNG